MAKAPVPKRGDIWLVDFDPAVGAEVRKARPAVVMSVDAIGRLPLRIVVPVTDWKPAYAAYPWFVELQPTPTNRLAKHSGADAFQVKSVSQDRFVGDWVRFCRSRLTKSRKPSRCVSAFRKCLVGHAKTGLCPETRSISWSKRVLIKIIGE